MSHAMQHAVSTDRYAKCIEVSKRVRWEIERDVIRNRQFDYTRKFLPDGLSKVNELEFLDAAEKRLLSQIQGRTYANTFGLVEAPRSSRSAATTGSATRSRSRRWCASATRN